MTRKFVFATNNAHKLEELRAMVGGQLQLLSLQDIGCGADIPETATTLEGNALLKAQYVQAHFGMDCFADDTGLEVEALHGAPGVYSARYGDATGHNSEANMRRLLREMEGEENRKARFRTVIALLLDGETRYFEGVVNGTILREKRGTEGFGYDPLFVPDGYTDSFAQLGEEVKNRISHRARAVARLVDYLLSRS